ncbi:MAG TPA: alpha/beta fold hydrolase [Actinomycetes bacterium]
MTQDKVEAVVSNWYPRFLANGIDWFDLQRTLDGVDGWATWAPAWTESADAYERLGREALAAGHRVTAGEHLRRSALTLQFAQFVLTEDPGLRRALQERMVRTYGEAAPLLDPPAHRVEIPYGDGRSVVGYLRRPAGDGAPDDLPGVVVLVPGLESTKEQFSTYEPYFLRRGAATLSIEGPGQGEGGFTVPFRDATYAQAMAAVWAALEATEHGVDGVNPQRVVVVGTSFGGYLALRHASVLPGLRGVVDIAGPYDLRAFDELQGVTRDGFRDFVGATSDEEALALLSDVSLEGVLDGLPGPVLVVHGEQDRIIAVSHAHRVAADLGDRATVRLEPTGNHSCNNLAVVVRPAVADWVCDMLGRPEEAR